MTDYVFEIQWNDASKAYLIGRSFDDVVGHYSNCCQPLQIVRITLLGVAFEARPPRRALTAEETTGALAV